MTATTRLRLSFVIIVMSAIYGVLIAQDQGAAKGVSGVYVGLVLSIFLVVNLWRKP